MGCFLKNGDRTESLTCNERTGVAVLGKRVDFAAFLEIYFF